jgi:hypothetical protein
VREPSPRLQPDQVLDRVEGRQLTRLSRSCRASVARVELSTAETIRTHQITIWQYHARKTVPH